MDEDIYDDVDVQTCNQDGSDIPPIARASIYDCDDQEIYDDVEATASVNFVAEGGQNEEEQGCYTGLLQMAPLPPATNMDQQYMQPSSQGGLIDSKSGYIKMNLQAKRSPGCDKTGKEGSNLKRSTASLNEVANSKDGRSQDKTQTGGRKGTKLNTILLILVVLSNIISLGALAVAIVLLAFWRMEVSDRDKAELMELLNNMTCIM